MQILTLIFTANINLKNLCLVSALTSFLIIQENVGPEYEFGTHFTWLNLIIRVYSYLRVVIDKFC
jgi:hypothetical protein